MLSISFRTALLYNFGVAAFFVVIGLLSGYTPDIAKPNRHSEMPAFVTEERLAIEQQQEIDALRVRALFYFDVARGMRRARTQDESRAYDDMQILAFVAAGLFVVGGILALLLPRERNSR